MYKFYCAKCDSHVDDPYHNCTLKAPKLLALEARDIVVWNEAIEAAACKCEDVGEIGMAMDIRELKK